MAQWRVASVRMRMRSLEKFIPTTPPPLSHPPPSPMVFKSIPSPPPAPLHGRLLPQPPPAPGHQVFTGTMSMLAKRFYHTNIHNHLDCSRPSKAASMLSSKRNICLKAALYSANDACALRVTKFSEWLKREARNLLLALKASLMKYCQYLKMGFKDRAISLVFNAHVLMAYGALCWGIEKMEETLSLMERKSEGGLADDLAQMARKSALFILLVLKKVLMFWSNEGIKEEVRHHSDQFKKVDQTLQDMGEQNVGLKTELDGVQARVMLLEEEAKKGNAEPQQSE